MDLLTEALHLFLTVENLVFIVIGILVGQILGAIPGMSSMMAISIAIPFTYSLSPVTAITLLMSFYKGALSGGSISATLIGTPGTASAAATVMDSHPLALKGQAGKALQTAQISSAMGSLFADILLITLTGFMAQIALMMSSPELLIIVTFALLTVSTFTAGNRIRGVLSAVMGISVTMIGTDPSTGLPRFSFGNPNLEVSLNIVPVLLGVLALSEIFYQTYLNKLKDKGGHIPPPQSKSDSRMTLKDFKNSFKTIIQSSFIGSFIGMLPGLGPSIGGFLAHKEARRTTKNPEMLGRGSVEGVAAAEAGNSSVAGSNLIPLLSFGIPGDAEAAMVMAALMLHGLYPGPQLLETDGPIVYGVFISLILSDFVLLLIGLFIIKYLAFPITKISTKYLYTAVLILMLAGTYGITQSLFDLWVLVVFGIVGLVIRLFSFSIPAFIIGFILGGQFEGWLQRTIVLVKSNPVEVLTRPLVIILLISVIIINLVTTFLSRNSKET